MLIGQISDCHMTAPDTLAYGYVDTTGRLRRVMQAIGSLAVAPDLMLGTGDLVQSGKATEYAALRAELKTLQIPFYPLPGNHDERSGFRNAFPELAPTLGHAEFIQYVVDAGDLRVLMLDTVQAGSDVPAFCEQRLVWLREQLQNGSGPVLVAMHHPPFPCGVGWVDAGQGNWSTALGEALADSGRVRGIVCGHVHRPMHRLWHGMPVSTAPATAAQVALDFSTDAAPALSLEPPGFQLHRWDGDALTTYTVVADGGGERISL